MNGTNKQTTFLKLNTCFCDFNIDQESCGTMLTYFVMEKHLCEIYLFLLLIHIKIICSL